MLPPDVSMIMYISLMRDFLVAFTIGILLSGCTYADETHINRTQGDAPQNILDQPSKQPKRPVTCRSVNAPVGHPGFTCN